jgi:prepilin-type N-terminal cleavage/methylation domain-containing protein
MSIFISKRAFTLIELMVSLALVSIVLLGIFSINMVLSNNNIDYGQRYLVKSDTQNTLNHILNDASLATGSGITVGTPPEVDKGILTAADGLTTDQICIHEDQAGDNWVCYKFDGAAFQISSCSKPYLLTGDATGKRGANAACAYTFVGTAKGITPTFTNTGNQLLFTVNIWNCLDDTALTCDGGGGIGISSDTANNPEVSLTASTTQPQENI